MQLGIRDVAALFEVADKTVYRWVEEDGLPAHEVEGQHRFHRAEVLEWATTRDLSPSPELFSEDGDSGCTIASALTRGGVFHEVPSATRTEAIASIVARLPGLQPSDRSLLSDVLLARDGFGKSGGPHIAIPHVRHPLIFDVSAPSLCLFFFATPVDLDSTRTPSDTHTGPVAVAFTLITPSVRAHLVMLARLTRLVHDDTLRAFLERRAPAADVIATFAQHESV